jgi:uncharacterized membrane protein
MAIKKNIAWLILVLILVVLVYLLLESRQRTRRIDKTIKELPLNSKL